MGKPEEGKTVKRGVDPASTFFFLKKSAYCHLRQVTAYLHTHT